MAQNPKVNELLEVLASRGMNEDAIKNVQESLWEQANEGFVNELMAALGDEDLQSVEVSGNQDEANAILGRLYEEKTGKNMHDEMNRIVDQYATELIMKYKVEDGVPLPVSSSTDTGSASTDDASGGDEATTPPVEAVKDDTDPFFKPEENVDDSSGVEAKPTDDTQDKKEEEETIHDLS